MRKIAATGLLLTMMFCCGQCFSANLSSCSFKGIPLHGKVKVVNSFADIKVKVVESFEDLKVQVVEHFPDDCGKWQFVDSFPDFTVQYVNSFPDITIRFVNHFPGTN